MATVDASVEWVNSGSRGRRIPTGLKWEGLLQTEETTYLVCNGAEGEPATFKDRLLVRSNLYQLLEGVAIAACATGATAAYVAFKKAFQQEARGLEGCDSVFKVFCHLCGYRHKWHYADSRIMPIGGPRRATHQEIRFAMVGIIKNGTAGRDVAPAASCAGAIYQRERAAEKASKVGVSLPSPTGASGDVRRVPWSARIALKESVGGAA